ncbi:cobalt-precorrin-8X methylmutase [Aphanothece hegewaldii CCALA 016]|uniref:Cobalt-precorrin-8X methylmutase n=1 Tax=Aphanothece hegewaldii CCALA 016 TaxID=2107694 RepID=A0A2T1LUX1_9CHRO|nr:cobalt-precorrin-8X methylmutase [Aphanothece hegewaldii CCALA 016]
MNLNHPILEQSFAIIDQEIGEHSFNALEYAIVRRIIHATADFEYTNLLIFSSDAIEKGIESLRNRCPIITDVSMVKQGIKTLVSKTFQNPIITAVEQVTIPEPNKTLTETGILKCFERYPEAIYVIGNAPTALLALCQEIEKTQIKPSLVIGVPVGFVSVVESKQALAQINIPQISVKGRKGGSPVASAIINAILILAMTRELSEQK